MNNKAGLSLHS